MFGSSLPIVFPYRAQEVPVIKLGELDSEQQFVSTDGWYGEAGVSFLAAPTV